MQNITSMINQNHKQKCLSPRSSLTNFALLPTLAKHMLVPKQCHNHIKIAHSLFFRAFLATSSTIFTNYLYSYKTHLESAIINTHQVLTFWRIFKPLVSMISINLLCSRCLFKQWAKHIYIEASKASIFATSNMLDKVCTTVVHWWAMKWISH